MESQEINIHTTYRVMRDWMQLTHILVAKAKVCAAEGFLLLDTHLPRHVNALRTILFRLGSSIFLLLI